MIFIKKNIVIILLVIIFALLAFQAYMDQQFRLTNGALVAHISTIETFIKEELPAPMGHFNSVHAPTK